MNVEWIFKNVRGVRTDGDACGGCQITAVSPHSLHHKDPPLGPCGRLLDLITALHKTKMHFRSITGEWMQWINNCIFIKSSCDKGSKIWQVTSNENNVSKLSDLMSIKVHLHLKFTRCIYTNTNMVCILKFHAFSENWTYDPYEQTSWQTQE